MRRCVESELYPELLGVISIHGQAFKAYITICFLAFTKLPIQALIYGDILLDK